MRSRKRDVEAARACPMMDRRVVERIEEEMTAGKGERGWSISVVVDRDPMTR